MIAELLRVLPTDLMAGALCRRAGWVYITPATNPARLRVQVLHELVEALWQWEGAPPQVSSHGVACQVVRMAV